jgi:hypothetical protein
MHIPIRLTKNIMNSNIIALKSSLVLTESRQFFCPVAFASKLASNNFCMLVLKEMLIIQNSWKILSLLWLHFSIFNEITQSTKPLNPSKICWHSINFILILYVLFSIMSSAQIQDKALKFMQEKKVGNCK